MSFFYDDYDSLFKEPRPIEASGLTLRLLAWDIHWADLEAPLEEMKFDETNEDRPSKQYQINKIRAMKKYIEDVKEPDQARLTGQFRLLLGEVLDVIQATSRLMQVFGVNAITWNGLDVTQLATNLQTLSNSAKEYCDAKEQYYNVLPTKGDYASGSFYSIDYSSPDIPDSVKERHRDIGILQANLINKYRNETYKFIGKIKMARAVFITAMNVAAQLSPQIAKQRDELMKIQEGINEIVQMFSSIRTTLIAVGPIVARSAQPTGDGVIASLHSGLMGLVTAILDTLSKLIMYINYFLGINNDYEEYLRELRYHDSLVSESSAQL